MKSLVLKTWSVVLLLLAAGALHAQAACPPGTVPYGTGNDLSVCGPDNSQQQQTPRQRAPQPPPEQWANRWGAIATDATKGTLGSINTAASETEAEQGAIADCQAKGGTQCKLQVSFRNGCAAMVLGDKVFNVNSGPTLNEATQKGMAMCTSASGNCHVYFSICSSPVRIQ